MLCWQELTHSSVVYGNTGSGGPGSMVTSGNGGSGVSSDSDRSSGVGTDGDGSGNMVGVGHNGGGNGLLDDGLTLDSYGVGDIVGSINMDGGGDLNNLLGVEGGIIRDLDTSLNIDGLVDSVDLGLGLDNGGTDRLATTENSGDLDGKMRGGGLVDGGSVSRDIAGLAQVNLLGDDGGGLVDGGHTLSLGVNRVGSGQGNGSGGDGSYWSSGDNTGGMAKKTRSIDSGTVVGEETSMVTGKELGSSIGAGDNAKCNLKYMQRLLNN